MKNTTQRNSEGPSEEVRNPEIRDQAKALFIAAGFREETSTTKNFGGRTIWLTHPSGRHVYLEADADSPSGWLIMIRGGLDKSSRGKIARLLGKLSGEEDDNRKDILEESGQFRLGELLPKPDDEQTSKDNETYVIDFAE